MTHAVIIVPWRDKGDPQRQLNKDVVVAHLQLGPIPVCVYNDGRDGDAPFNRSAAYNRGVSDHHDADVYLFHEADMIVPHDQLTQAIEMAQLGPGLVVPYDTYHYLSPEGTKAVRDGMIAPEELVAERRMVNGKAVGAVGVVSAQTMLAVGQWDEVFEGWGFDDRAMAWAFQVATGTATRFIRGTGYHLWHTPGWSERSRFAGGAPDVPEAEQAATVANEHRYRKYRFARTPRQVRQLTAGG